MSSCVPWVPTPVSDMTRELSPFYASSDPTPSPPLWFPRAGDLAWLSWKTGSHLPPSPASLLTW